MISEESRKRMAIQHILASKHIGFFRLCGKDLQKKYRKANNTYSNPNREQLLNEIIAVYKETLENKQPSMTYKEKSFKTKLIMRFARKQWVRRK